MASHWRLLEGATATSATPALGQAHGSGSPRLLSGGASESRRLPLKGSFKGDIDVARDVDVDIDIVENVVEV